MQCPVLPISKLADVNAGAAAQILRSTAAVALVPMQRRVQMRGGSEIPPVPVTRREDVLGTLHPQIRGQIILGYCDKILCPAIPSEVSCLGHTK